MKRPDFSRFVRPGVTIQLLLTCFLTLAGIYPLTVSSKFLSALLPGAALCEEPPSGSIEGTWQLMLPMPGGTKESDLVLAARGEALSGTMSNPGDPADVHPIYDGVRQGTGFSLSTDIGRITYHIKGTLQKNMLSFDLETNETIPLGDGHRLEGNSGEISGKYLVPVYSPGGVMENHFELVAENGMITGQMYVPASENETSPDKMAGAPPGMDLPPGGPPSGGPPADMGAAASGGKRDINTFYEGTYEGSRLDLFTRTAQGSVFHFTGTIAGDAIRLTLHVTDQRKGLEALRIE